MAAEKKAKKVVGELVGRAKGGAVVAQKMTPEQRSERAKKGSAARWGLRATHKGSFKQEFGLDVDCYVLNDAKKTAVITQTGMAEAIGLSARGDSIRRFANGRVMASFVGSELLEKLEKPLKFQWRPVGTENLIVEANGYDVTLLIDICKAIISADLEGRLSERQKPMARQAQIIMSASAKAGIEGLVYALAGYDRTKEEIIEAYKLYVRDEAREYEREFSPELYEQWYRLYGLAKPERGRPWEFRYLTIDHIYKPLANSQGKVFDLAKSSKAAKGEPRDKVHQFLSEVGVKALRTQVGKIIGIASVSDSRAEYEKYIQEKVYGQKSFDFK
ncbi:P63C domain-containing protein [Stenotrophomonas acidaminiphila]|uniref:P63C domain-containing protein n=1 Tax=Stenotrophomonas acidaminiphila TaxID=128780 RepID=UPI003D01D0AD